MASAKADYRMGWMVVRADGTTFGPYHTRADAEDQLFEGDTVYRVGEHGNVIDYGPQFGEDDLSADESLSPS